MATATSVVGSQLFPRIVEVGAARPAGSPPAIEIAPSCVVLEELGVSLVVPAHDEELRLPSTLESYLSAFEARALPFEIVVVVDGSADSTAEVARRFTSRNVHVLEYASKLGKGGAVLEGMRASRYGVVGFLDADGPVSPECFLSLVAHLDSHDCAIASRHLPGSKVSKRQPVHRVLLGRAWNLAVRGTLHLPFSDTQCGAKVFRRSVALPVLRKVHVTNWAFDVDLLFHLHEAGSSIVEVPVAWAHEDGSRLSSARAVVAMFASLLGICLMNHRVARYVPSAVAARLYSLVAAV